jgi:ribose transport system ATP-binding protein
MTTTDRVSELESRAVAPALEVRSLSKSFGGVRALDDVSLTVERGEIRSLIGVNGSGKSTLIKLLSGYHTPDPGGSVLIDGRPLELGSAERSLATGCRFVHQDLGLVGSLSVMDNLFLGAGFPARLGTIKSRVMRRAAQEMLDRVGVGVDPRAIVSTLAPTEQTGIAVARALRSSSDGPPRLLVLDEPTAALPPDEVQRLLAMIASLAGTGVGILYVTHHLEEVSRVGDTVTVLRDGKLVKTAPVGELSRRALVDLLLGSRLRDELEEDTRLRAEATASVLHHRRQDVSTEPTLVVDRLSAGALRDVSLDAEPGEILGIAGLTGSGRETLLGAIFGGVDRTSGRVLINGRELLGGRPDEAIALGVGFVTGDRKTTGAFMSLSARENLTLGDVGRFWNGVGLSRKQETAEVESWFETLDVRPRDGIDKPFWTFSGGNQQKVILAKWLRLEPSVLLLDEPTQGVDVGAKAELHRHLMDVAARRGTIIISSSDLEELAALCSRILLIRDGAISAEMVGGTESLVELNRSLVSSPMEVEVAP